MRSIARKAIALGQKDISGFLIWIKAKSPLRLPGQHRRSNYSPKFATCWKS